MQILITLIQNMEVWSVLSELPSTVHGLSCFNTDNQLCFFKILGDVITCIVLIDTVSVNGVDLPVLVLAVLGAMHY